MLDTQQIFLESQETYIPWGIRAIFHDVMDLVEDGNYNKVNDFTMVELEPCQHDIIDEHWDKFEQYLETYFKSKWQAVALSELHGENGEITFFVLLKSIKRFWLSRLFSKLFSR